MILDAWKRSYSSFSEQLDFFQLKNYMQFYAIKIR